MGRVYVALVTKGLGAWRDYHFDYSPVLEV